MKCLYMKGNRWVPIHNTQVSTHSQYPCTSPEAEAIIQNVAGVWHGNGTWVKYEKSLPLDKDGSSDKETALWSEKENQKISQFATSRTVLRSGFFLCVFFIFYFLCCWVCHKSPTSLGSDEVTSLGWDQGTLSLRLNVAVKSTLCPPTPD